MDQDEYRYVTIDYARPLSDKDIANKRHRRRVGGKWELMGPLQRDFLVAHGLEPGHRLLDVGCGSLRAGIHFVEYLQPGNYYGIDVNETLLDAGYERELPARLRERLPRDHLRSTGRFDCDFGVDFDYAIAQSLFTHVSLNHVRLCLYRVGKQMRPDGRFYATFFEAPRSHPLDQSMRDGRRWTERNAFFYYRSDLRWAARSAGLDMRYIGAWSHPAGQRMVEFHRARMPGRQGLVERAASHVSPRVKRSIKRALNSRT